MVANAARIGEQVLGPGLRQLAQRHPSVRRGARPGCVLGHRIGGQPRDPRALAPHGSSSPAMNDVLAACKSGGLLPFGNFNRIHACPTVQRQRHRDRGGLTILDAALDVADRHVVG